MDKLAVLRERDELTKKAERGEITAAEYWRELVRTWELMSPAEKTIEYAKVR